MQYVEEQMKRLSQLMLQLDNVPVGKSHNYMAASGTAASVVVQLQRRLKKYSVHTQPVQGPSSRSISPNKQDRANAVLRSGGSGMSPCRRISTFGWIADENQQQPQQQLMDGLNVQFLSSISHLGGNISKMSIQLSFSLEVCVAFHLQFRSYR